MNNDEIRRMRERASARTGVPAELITGETSAEIEASASALAEFRRKSYDEAPTRDKFAAWLNGTTPAEFVPDPTPINVNSYPIVPDGGTPQNIEYRQDPRDAFALWFADISAFDPRKNHGNW